MERKPIAHDPYEAAFGLIELKQDIYGINKAQDVLELASIARTRRVGKNSSLLATNNGSCAGLKMKEQLFVEFIAVAANALKTSEGY